MENEDTKRWAPRRGRRDPGDTFARAMSDVVVKCRLLVVAIDNHDYEGVEHVARQAASMWLTGRAAHRRLTPRPEDQEISDGEKSLLEARTTLVGLFTRAKATIAVPHMQRALDELDALLTSADVELDADAEHHS